MVLGYCEVVVVVSRQPASALLDQSLIRRAVPAWEGTRSGANLRDLVRKLEDGTDS